MAGVIATNTTLAADGSGPGRRGARGRGRRPVRASADRAAPARWSRSIHQQTGGALPIIGVGGIIGPHDATALFDAGASLVQLYTGLIYQGPGLVRDINKSLA